MTLSEIINAVWDGERPPYDDLRYAICAMEALAVFDQMGMERLVEAEQTAGQTGVGHRLYEESFQRHKRAYTQPPKSYVGWNNDPDNPEFLARRQQAKRLVDSILLKGKSDA